MASLCSGLLVAISIGMAVVWLSGFGDWTLTDPDFMRRVPIPELRAALGVMARAVDATWLVLASVAVYLALVRAEGLAVARRWAGMIIAVGFILPTASAITGWPLGPVFYPRNLGPKIGLIPFALPLLWLVIILGAREVSWRLLPRAGHGAVAVVTGLLVLLTTLNLDRVATTYRAWWLWHPGGGEHSSRPPTMNFVSWALAGIALAWTMRTPHVVPRQQRRPTAPIAVIAFLNALALLTSVVIGWK